MTSKTFVEPTDKAYRSVMEELLDHTIAPTGRRNRFVKDGLMYEAPAAIFANSACNEICNKMNTLIADALARQESEGSDEKN